KLPGFLAEPVHNRALAANRDVLGLETGFDVDPELALGQVADVAHRGLDLVAPAEEPLDGPGLGRRLDDDQGPSQRDSSSNRSTGCILRPDLDPPRAAALPDAQAPEL